VVDGSRGGCHVENCVLGVARTKDGLMPGEMFSPAVHLTPCVLCLLPWLQILPCVVGFSKVF
jgi:hypothetical protein